ncbi:Transporter protein SLAC1/Mae1/ Ssu1/TehA [Dillenia turbinata]|uniref:Transporter protein SLAC1/Mae1/ Ssu1/TehA n=1 Tax=Dillenia turbinata TaxID=194707 RepID=A0AAN8ZEX8_9MAGN
MDTNFVDIHEVFNEEDGVQRVTEKAERRKPNKFREAPKRHNRSLSRQVSLETGFAVLGRESKSKDERKVTLTRNGRSFGGFTAANRVGGEPRKGDFSIFRTKSTLGKQNSLLPIRKECDADFHRSDGHGHGHGGHDESEHRSDYEDILLPKDEIWPFLLRFPIGCFGICLGLSSQAILWRALATSPATKFLHVTPIINLVLWCLAFAVLISITFTYVLKCVFYFEAVRREYFHPVRVNFFFAPWIVCMFLAIGAPSMVAPERLHPAIWCVFMGPIFFLELKIYGQWLSGGKRRLCKVANPSTHLSVVGNFVGSILASKVGWLEPAKFLWAIGISHYLVVFVTLYQRLPTSEALPKELHPVYSMFIAAPSAASIAWEAIYGEFDATSRNCYFIALFLYISLVVRINFFRGFRFSVAWWSYTFPMTTASLATIKYAEQVPCAQSKALALILSFMSSTMVSVLFVSTLLHAFVWRTLFPNDLAIAITKTRQTKEKKPFKKAYDIRRWTKQSPLSIVSAIKKHTSAYKELDGEKEADR